MSAAIRPAVKKVAKSFDENQNGSRRQRRPSPDYMPTERTSTASYKSPSTGKKKTKQPHEPVNITGLSAALDYIRSPVRYLTSVFTQPISDPQKSPPKSSKSRRMATILESSTPRFVETEQMPETESVPVANVDKPPEGLDTMNTELYHREPIEPVIERKVDPVPIVVREKKPAHSRSDNKKGSDPKPKRSSSQLMKHPSKTRISFSTRNFRENKRQSPSPTARIQPMSPRILSASSIKFASYNNRSYRVTSTEKEESSKSKKPNKKVFKIDRDKSPVSSIKNQSSPTAAEKREEVTYNYVPLNAIEISRL